MNETNPAERLYILLRKAKGISPQEQAKTAYLKLFNIKNTPELFETLLRLGSMISQTKQFLIEASPDHNELYLKCFKQIERFAQPENLLDHFGSYTNPITDVVFAHLEHCVVKLSETIKEKQLQPSDIENIIVELTTLFNLVNDSAIDLKLKQSLLQQIENTRHLVSQYQIWGASILEDAAIGVAVHVAKNKDLYIRNEHDTNVNSFMAIIRKINDFVKFAYESTPTLYSSIKELTGMLV